MISLRKQGRRVFVLAVFSLAPRRLFRGAQTGRERGQFIPAGRRLSGGGCLGNLPIRSDARHSATLLLCRVTLRGRVTPSGLLDTGADSFSFQVN